MKRFSLLSLVFFTASCFAQNTSAVAIGGDAYTDALTVRTPSPRQTPPFASPQLPKLMMTSAWPLNQPAVQFPDETRSLNSGNPFTPKSIKDTFYSTFGRNHIQFNTTMPVTVVDTRQTPNIFTSVMITTNWGSDNASYVPVLGCKIEGGVNAPANSDRHCLIYDAATGLLHELFGVTVTHDRYSALAYREWNTAKAEQGSPGQNSADAAGLPILPLVLRWAEANTGAINHALRMTISLSRANANGGVFTSPASHASGQNWSSTAYMGQRFYLRRNYPTAGLSPIALAIVTCLKSYGVVIADNGISGLVVADDDSHWDGRMLNNLGSNMTLQDFTPVNSGAIIDSSGERAE